MNPAASISAKVVAFALPPRCAGCGQIVAQDLELCVSCWQSLDFLTGQGCEACGARVPPGAIECAPCMQHPPDHDGALAAVAYGDVARHLVLKLKHGRRIGLAKLFAKLMAQRLPREAGLLIPVPLHRWRIWHRGFNQSLLIARHLSWLSGLPLDWDILRRTKPTPMLRNLSAGDRAKAVGGAFTLAPDAKDRLEGRTVFLVDDVYTSGATANACARTLKRGKAEKVVVVSWARVILEDSAD